MKCPKCGYENKEDAGNCNLCGEVLLKISRNEANFALDSLVDFNEKYVPFERRCLAFIIDCLLLYMVRMIFLLFWGTIRYKSDYYYFSRVISFFGHIIYFAFFDISDEKGTPGKMLLRIEVVNDNKGRISFKQSSLRALAKALVINGHFFLETWYIALPLFVPFLIIPLKQYKQGLLNTWLKTFIINKKEEENKLESVKTRIPDIDPLVERFFTVMTASQVFFALFLLFCFLEKSKKFLALLIFNPLLFPLYFFLCLIYIGVSIRQIVRAKRLVRVVGTISIIIIVGVFVFVVSVFRRAF